MRSLDVPLESHFTGERINREPERFLNTTKTGVNSIDWLMARKVVMEDRINRNHATLACNKDKSVACRRNSTPWPYLRIYGGIWFYHICALENRDVGRTEIRWIVNMLNCRNIHLTYQGESVKARIVKDSPQRGVLSPPLWCIVVDSLFLKLNVMRHSAQAYTDDVAIVIQGKYLNTVVNLTQRSLWVVDCWCKASYTQTHRMVHEPLANSSRTKCVYVWIRLRTCARFAYHSPQTKICWFFARTQRELDAPGILSMHGCPLLALGLRKIN